MSSLNSQNKLRLRAEELGKLSPSAKRRYEEATNGAVVYTGNNKGPLPPGRPRANSGKYTSLSKLKTKSNTRPDLQLNLLPRSSRNIKVNEDDYAEANMDNNDNNDNPQVRQRLGAMSRTTPSGVRPRSHAIRGRPSFIKNPTAGGARKKTRKYKKESKSRSRSRKSRK